MNHINIIVAGNTGTGKTAISEKLVRLLKAENFNIEYIPLDEDRLFDKEQQIKREQTVKENTLITISEKHTFRRSLTDTAGDIAE